MNPIKLKKMEREALKEKGMETSGSGKLEVGRGNTLSNGRRKNYTA
nr:hypothetical protein [Candidatus Freyarchaeota archaeon]